MTVMLERPTAIETPEGPPRYQALFRTLLTMEVPEGYRAEIIGGNIVMSPWSKGYYLDVMDTLVEQLMPHLPEGQRVSYAPFLFALPGQERAYGPDIYVAAREAFRTHDRYIDGEALTLVAELTSDSTRNVDWTDKLPVYAKAGVPVYLLLDMQEHTISVFTAPTPLGYAERRTYEFGDTVQLPPPFDCEIETTGFGDMPGKAVESE
ncbi:Uma2 family endonuclease [Streptomyces sp. NPDC053499]|uniref:Uma2 family endonuclease n=1 Tax=Streptomyces sp. NPDC053499 TaxID=3365707 RepID=UPI0037D9151C